MGEGREEELGVQLGDIWGERRERDIQVFEVVKTDDL
jgi:hypothetical protein